MDRTDAGRHLAGSLDRLRGNDVVVLGLPRGGVPVAYEVARQMGASQVILAVPVGAPESLDALRKACDDVVCSYAPPFFMAVGTFYDDFRHVSDHEVSALLARAHEAAKLPAAGAQPAGAPGAAPAGGTVPGADGPRSDRETPGHIFATRSQPPSAGPRER